MEANRRDLVTIIALQIRELVETSSSDSDNDELEILEKMLNKRRKVSRVQNYVETVVPGLTSQDFKAHFRMLPGTFEYLLSIIEPILLREKTEGAPMISPRKQCLLALWRLATPDSLRSISDRFNVGRSTALYITRRVINALIELAPTVIKWPTNERVGQVWAGFEANSGFPKVIGAIDGTHINIPAPKDDPAAYVNRKSHHSIQLQAICDHTCQFIHCYVGHVGSVHDQRVFRLSEVQSYLGDVSKFPQDCHLVGDLAYKLHENLLIPYRDNGHMTQRQRNCNFCHASARIAIERAFGLLKGRFRSLLTTLAMDRVDLIPLHILACCVLHNVCLMKNDDFNIEVIEDVDVIDCVMANNENMRDAAYAGAAKRDLIAQRLRLRNV
ncbi:protein ANTAGONIST OF LIKE HETEROCHROMATIN PROTEIN 1-like isoform X1 [Temnothorax curvispinosus]|uniref:Putative nuclease HARBI1 n=2 Tax=Temnothorax curvispinosus TaxID=300111 RepID=A0A6J1QNE2_9HYME|nr:protein ANTAGONIST OF LIKE HETEROCHROMATIN PROTEIN 1-like isoform X1 [Temnothorax curvispinosus]